MTFVHSFVGLLNARQYVLDTAAGSAVVVDVDQHKIGILRGPAHTNTQGPKGRDTMCSGYFGRSRCLSCSRKGGLPSIQPTKAVNTAIHARTV